MKPIHNPISDETRAVLEKAGICSIYFVDLMAYLEIKSQSDQSGSFESLMNNEALNTIKKLVASHGAS